MLEAPKVIELYLSGKSSGYIAKMFDVTPGGVIALLNRHNIDRRESKESLRKADDNKILELYNSKINPTNIAKQLNISVTTVTNSLRRTCNYAFNPIIYDYSWPKDNMFELYYVGLLLADGCYYIRRKRGPKSLGMESKGKTLHLVLHKSDIDVLKEIQKVISPSRHIKVDKNCVRFEIPVDDKIDSILNMHGITERKSLTLKPTEYLKSIDDHQFYQLLVGFIEGDGSIMIKNIKAPNGKKYKHIQLSIISTFEFLSWIKDRIEKSLNIKTPIPKSYNRSVFEWRVTGSKASTIINKCKESKYLFMDRKWSKSNYL